jgi:hypothetical protein
MKLWLNVADAAEHAGVCRDTIYTAPNVVLAAAVNSTFVAGENPTVGSTVWLPAASLALGR